MPTILIVEDDPTVSEGIRRTLQAEYFTVRLAEDGLSALEWLTHYTPDLILADVMMPQMNGYQLYQRVRQNPEWLHVPFIFFTAKGEAEDIRYGKELGADDYLTKPVDPEDLVAAVRGRLTRFEQLNDRSQPSESVMPSGRYEFSGVMVDLARRQLFVQDEEVGLSPTEFDVMQRLILAEGAVVAYEDLLGYEEDDLLGERDAADRLRYHIRNIRGKLRAADGPDSIILNVRSVGYRLAETPKYLGDHIE